MGLSVFRELKKMKDLSGMIVLEGESLKKLQTIILSIVKDIMEVCEEHQIHAMLGYGSALGAIRHQGMIPWDDDVDIIILREDYNRFIRIFQQKYADKYWIHVPGRTKNYGSVITKVLRKGTVVRKFEDCETEECGAFVDIMVLENTFDHFLARRIHMRVAYLLFGLLSCRRTFRDAKYILPVIRDETKLVKKIKAKAAIGKLCCFWSLDRWVKINLKWAGLCRNKKSKYVIDAGAPRELLMEAYERRMFQKRRKVKFGEYVWDIPFCCEEYLEKIYGDYRRIPSKEEREKHVVLELKL